MQRRASHGRSLALAERPLGEGIDRTTRLVLSLDFGDAEIFRVVSLKRLPSSYDLPRVLAPKRFGVGIVTASSSARLPDFRAVQQDHVA